MVKIELDYEDWKLEVSNRSLDHQSYVNKGNTFLLAFDGQMYFYHSLESDNQADYDTTLAASANKRINNKTSLQNAMPVVSYKIEDDSFVRATHDFTNKCTWYTNSVRVTDEVLSTSDNLTYTAANTHFIDVRNGVVNRQDTLQAYALSVLVDDVSVTDYTVDHAAGSITFPTSQTGVIKCTYSYATDSVFTLEPASGKVLFIEHSEVQFSKDVEINTPLKFEIYVGNPYYGVVGHPYEFITKLPYQVVQYNSVRDLINEANLGTGYIPQMADLPDDILVFPFNYLSVKPFKHSIGAELRVSAVDDIELTGSFGTATFYLTSKDE